MSNNIHTTKKNENIFKSATSPFTCLPIAQLTPSGLLLLDTADGEVEVLQRHGNLLELRSEAAEPLSSHANYKDRIAVKKIILTTHRIVFTQTNNNESRFLHLSNIHACERVATSVFSQHCKVRVSTYSLGELIFIFPKKESILESLQKTLERRAWETAARLQQQQKKSSTRRVGVDAILASQKQKHQRASQLTDQAFTGDAETLLREATELVAIIQKYASTLDTRQNNKQDTAMADMLSDMGMTSALPTMGSDKSTQYYETLARHLHHFLTPKLTQTSGIMTLTDVYCLYNRARGTNLISPSDLLAAVEQFNHIPTLQLSIKTFSSGLKVVVSTQVYNQDELNTKLRDLCGSSYNTGLTTLDASHVLKMSALLAQEALLEAEQSGFLCRDVTLETTRFYQNKFATGEFAKW